MTPTGNNLVAESEPTQSDKAFGQRTAPNHAISNRVAALLWFAAIAPALPMLCFYLVGLWKLEHYQFFPLVFAAVIALAASRYDGTVDPPSGTITRLLIACGLISILVSIGLFSPWFSAVGFVLIAACLLATLREPSGRRLTVLALPLLSLIRLPLNFDSLLITSLQRSTSRIASWFLDIAAVPHMVSGNIIELVHRDLFVAEACSGIQSVFTLVFLASLILAYRRRPLWMAPVYWTVALMAAVLGNSFRVAAVSTAASLGIDWATGLNHTVVGYVALGAAFALLLSFDQWIAVLIHPIQGVVFEAEDWVNPMIKHWDRYVVGAMPRAPETHPPIAAQTIGDETVLGNADRATQRSTIAPMLAVVFVLMVASLLVAVNQSRDATLPALFATRRAYFQPPLNALDDMTVPVSVLGHQRVQEAENPRLGDSADIWTVGTRRWQGQLVLSQAFTGWHELCICYRNLQWQLNDRLVIESSPPTKDASSDASQFDDSVTSSGGRPGFVLATFQKGIASRGYLLFTAITYDGKLVSPPITPGPLGHLVNRLSTQPSNAIGDVMMLQLWIEAPEELNADDLDLAKKAFQETRDRLVAAIITKPEI